MINHTRFCLDYVYSLYTSTKYIDCFNEHLVNMECTIEATNDMVQNLGIRIKSLYNDYDAPIEIRFWVGKKWSDFKDEIEKMIKDDYVIDENSFAMTLCKGVLDSLIHYIQFIFESNSNEFNYKLMIDDGDYEWVLKKNDTIEKLANKALKEAKDKLGELK